MRALHYIFLVVWMCPCAFSTSIIVKLEENRILLVADTKVDELRDGKPIADQNSFVNECKIEGRGKVALAIFGYSKFRRTNPLVTVSEWNGIDSFVQLSAIAQDDLVQASDLWAAGAMTHLQTRHPSDAGFLRQIAQQGDGLLIRGVFVGWVQDRPTFIWEDILLKDTFSEPFSTTRQMGSLKPDAKGDSRPFATTKTSTALLDPKTELGKKAAQRWEQEKTKFSKSERDWRWLTFVIKMTSEREKGVGPDADVLEVTRTGAKWLHTASCK